MGYIEAAVIIIKLIGQVFGLWIEFDKEKKEKKKILVGKIEQELPNAFKNKDASAINALFNDINSL